MIPQGMPPVSDNTESAMRIRAAYVKHHISLILTRCIFQPFLFVLEPRLAPADRLFREMSEELKRKSTKREAMWRQRTLYAAFTAPSAKQTINKVATRIVDEIMRTIRCFTPETRWPLLLVAVRHVVKQAAETWRYARLELGLISASMDGKDIVQAPTKGAGVPSRNDAMVEELLRNILLPLFPVIKRDPMIGDLLGKPDLHDEGCTFSAGQILYRDDTDVVACQEGIFKHSTRPNQPRMSLNSSPKVSKTQGQETRGRPSRESPTHRTQARTQDQKDEVDQLREPPTSRTESPTKAHQEEEEDGREEEEGEEGEDISRDSPMERAEPREQDGRMEDVSPRRSPTGHRGAPASDDRLTSLPTHLHHHNRARRSPEVEALKERRGADRDSSTPTPVQDHGADLALPDDGPSVSDHSLTSSKVAVQSPTTQASQKSRQFMKGAGAAPSWENASGEVTALETRGDGW